MALVFDPILNCPRNSGLTLRATDNGDGTVTLAWSGYNLEAVDASGYWEVEESLDGSSWTAIFTTSPGQLGDDWGAGTLGVLNYYRVKAYDSNPTLLKTSNVVRVTLPEISELTNIVGMFDPRTESSFDTLTMADFNGTDQWLQCADHADFAVSGVMSVTFTCNRKNAHLNNPTGGDQDRSFLGQCAHATANGGGWMIAEGDGVNDNWNVFVWFATNSGSTTYSIAKTGTGGTGRTTPWSQCTVVIDLAGADHTTKVKVYLDGTLQPITDYLNSAALASLTTFYNPTSVFNIGRFQGLGRYFDGCMSRVGFWNGTALSAGNAATLWNSGDTSTYADVVAAGLTTNLKIWLNMDEASGTRSDSSGNAHHFTEGGGTQNSTNVVTEMRDLITGLAFTAYPGIGMVYSATGYNGHPAWTQQSRETGYYKGLHTNYFRDAAPQDVLDATSWGRIITSSEAGVFATSDAADKYIFTSQGWVTQKNGDTGYTDRAVPVFRIRDVSTPNDIIFMDVTALTANAPHTTQWRLTGTGGTLSSSYEAWFDNVSVEVCRNDAGTGVNKSFANIPASGNSYQAIGAYSGANTWQGTGGLLTLGGIVLASGNTDPQSNQLRTAWEARMA